MRALAAVRAGAAAAVLTGAQLAPAALSAQGLCAAPHSTGGMSARSSVGTLPPGAGWLQISVLRWVSDDFFGTDGEIRPLLADAVVTTHSVYLTGSIGLVTGVEAYVQAPFHDLRFEDQTGRRARAGVGDVRAALRLSPAALGVPVPVVVRAGIKLPGSDFPVDATVIPLTEGQRDWELSVEYGRKLIEPSPLAPPTLYGVVWLGHRWRDAHAESARKPGDEVFGNLALGGLLDPFDWELGLQFVLGRSPVQQGVRLYGARRELLQITPALSYPIGPGRASLGVQLPVAGRNLPAGASVSLGYLFDWSAF